MRSIQDPHDTGNGEADAIARIASSLERLERFFARQEQRADRFDRRLDECAQRLLDLPITPEQWATYWGDTGPITGEDEG